MATNKTYVSDGSQTIYTFDFDYISTDFVKVLVDGVEVGRTLSGTYQVTLDAAPAAGAVINITRQTDTDRIVEFVDGSILVAKDLNLSALQATHIAAEALSAASGSLLIDDTGAFSAGGRRITQTGEPVADDDVVTKGWVNTTGNTFIDATEAAQAAAEDARDQAQAARDTATVRRNEARTARDTAEAHRDDAETYRDEARAARDTAAVRRNEAETHKVAAEAAQTAAEAALASTEQIETDIGDLRADGAAAIAECQTQVGLAQTESSNAATSAAAAAQSAIDAAAAAGFDPADYADADHTHAWDEITDKPSLFKAGTEIPANADLNSYLTTGYYFQNNNGDAGSGTNYPIGQAGCLEVISDDTGNGLHTIQRYTRYNSDMVYTRYYYNGSWRSWAKGWNNQNDGPGSGLDADKLDGFHSSYFQKELQDTAQLEFGQNREAGNRFIDFHSDGLGTDFSARILRREGANGDFELVQTGTGPIEVNGGSNLTRDGNTIWHEGNSDFADASHTHDAGDITTGTIAHGVIPKASTSTAQTGLSNQQFMTPLRTSEYFDKRVTISTAEPTGGDDGDLWFKVD